MFRIRASLSSPPKRRDRNGQSVLEFALVAPIMIVMMLAVVDVARVYTTMVNIESAAREAADYGTSFGAGKWLTGVALDTNVQEMQRRACVASSKLPDYVDSDSNPATGCENPAFAYCVTPADGAACGPLDPADGCEVPTRTPEPCAVTVTMTYDFHLFAPVNMEFFGVQIGFPSTLNIQRDSTFAITDIDLSTVTPP